MTDYPNPGYVDDVAPLVQRIEPSWGNAIRDRVIHTFATTGDRDAAITSPKDGQAAWIIADAALTVYNGVAWSPPWNTAWGMLAPPAESTADQGPFTTANITDLVLSVDVPHASRLIRVRAHGLLSNDASAGPPKCQWRLTQDGTQVQRRNYECIASTSVALDVTLSTLTPATYVFQVTAGRSGGDGNNWTSIADPTFPAQLTVEDAGPAGVPT